MKRVTALTGFMLIELIIAMLIASMLSLMLFTILEKSAQFQTKVDRLINMHVRIGVVSNQLEKDLMGTFIPVQSEIKKESAPSTGSGRTENEKQDTEAAAGAQPAKKNPEKEEKKPLEKIFFSVHKNGRLETLSFISNNPLSVYVGDKVGKAKPKIARIQYIIQPEEGRTDSFVLLRQEGTELEFEPYKDMKKFKAYELVGGIKEISCTFTACIEKKPEEKKIAQKPAQEEKQPEKSEENKPKITYEYKTVPEWSSEATSESSAKAPTDKKTPWPRIPCRVEIKLTLWDMRYEKEQSFVLVFDVPIDAAIAKEEPEKKEAQASKSLPAEQSAGKQNQQPKNQLNQQTNKMGMQQARQQQQQPIVVQHKPGTQKVEIATFEDLLKLFGQSA